MPHAVTGRRSPFTPQGLGLLESVIYRHLVNGGHQGVSLLKTMVVHISYIEVDQMETERMTEMDIEMEMGTDLEGREEDRERKIQPCIWACRAAFWLNVYMENLFLHSRVNTKGTAPAHQKSQRMI